MSTEVVPFQFEGSEVRVLEDEGESWWVLSDVARLLGYRDAANAGRLLREKHRGTQIVSTPGGDQEVTIVSEGGLYRLILRSRSPIADRFQDWVTDEILPAIRRTGRYEAPGAGRASVVDALVDRLEFLTARLASLEATIRDQQPAPTPKIAYQALRRRKSDEAVEEWILGLFGDARELPSNIVRQAARDAEIGHNKLFAAKARLGIGSRKRGSDPCRWYWSIP